MKFHTEIDFPKYNFNIKYGDRICLMGSCFSDHIGGKLLEAKFNVMNNPLGITFNPASIANQIEYVFNPELIDADQLRKRDGLWHHFDFHGCFSDVDQVSVLERIKKQVLLTRAYFQNSKVLFITFGTATVYKRLETNRVVANNHKFPISEFIKYRIDVDSMVERYTEIIKMITSVNSDINIVFTVSPVRYTRDGLIENQRSKATLLLAIEKLVEIENTFYFPSYEIFMDVLRDYRYYKKDLVHPGDQGIEYVWGEIQGTIL
jgi:hypothetical protein